MDLSDIAIAVLFVGLWLIAIVDMLIGLDTTELEIGAVMVSLISILIFLLHTKLEGKE